MWLNLDNILCKKGFARSGLWPSSRRWVKVGRRIGAVRYAVGPRRLANIDPNSPTFFADWRNWKEQLQSTGGSYHKSKPIIRVTFNIRPT
jgi:hypothetical protein